MNKELSPQHFVWLVGSLCQLNRIPFDPALLVQRFPGPHSARQLCEAVQAFGFSTGFGRLAAAAYPCVGFLKGESLKPALIVRADDERLLYFEAGSQTPQTCPAALAGERFEPEVLLARHEDSPPLADEGAPGAAKFGFRWFVPELLRHKRDLARRAARLARRSS